MELFISDGESEPNETTAPQIGGKLENLAGPICANFNVESPSPSLLPLEGKGSPNETTNRWKLAEFGLPICVDLTLNPHSPLLIPLRRERETTRNHRASKQVGTFEIWPFHMTIFSYLTGSGDIVFIHEKKQPLKAQDKRVQY